LLTGAAAVAGATAFTQFSPTPARGAAPPVGNQNAGWYRYKVGTHEITVVTDGVTRFRFPDGFVVNRTREEVNQGLAAAAFMQAAPDEYVTPYTPIVVNTGAKLVVMDTGTGEANFERTKGMTGQFQNNLKAAGIDRNQVDMVVISHFHGDHINGLLTADNKPAFPNAEILVPDAEWLYFMDDTEMAKQTSERMKTVFAGLRRVFDALGRKVTRYQPDKELAPGITSLATFGHTPGHNSFVVASGTDKVFVQADITHTPLFVRNPSWHVMYDQDPNMAEATRRKTYDMLASERMMVQGFHYPFPSRAYIEKTPTGYRETMVAWSPVI
jgi:glyoxylase-like metal-dependent hydrolase (beta-lactamase superfamily II)